MLPDCEVWALGGGRYFVLRHEAPAHRRELEQSNELAWQRAAGNGKYPWICADFSVGMGLYGSDACRSCYVGGVVDRDEQLRGPSSCCSVRHLPWLPGGTALGSLSSMLP